MIVGPAHPLRGGIADFNEALATSIKSEGMEVVIFSFSLQYPALFFPGKTQFDETSPPQGIDIRPVINSINPVSWYSAVNKILSENPDLVVVRYWIPFLAPCLSVISRALKKQRIKVVAIADNIIPHEKRPGDKFLTSLFLKSVDAYMVMSKSVLSDLDKFGIKDKKVYAPHPVYDIFGSGEDKSDARKFLGLDVSGKWILFFGIVRKYKGLDILLRAMGDDRIKAMGVKLMVAGEFYDDRAEYDLLIKEYGLKESVRLSPVFIPQEEVKHYFCSADLVVQPYRSATQSGITQIAYHFGRPMLVTDVGGLSEIVINNKTGYVTSISPKSIADAICDYYKNNREEEMSRKVIAEKYRFTWKGFVNTLTELYKSLNES